MKKNVKKLLILNLPYGILGAVATNLGEAMRMTAGTNVTERIQSPGRVPKGQERKEISSQSGVRLCQVGNAR